MLKISIQFLLGQFLTVILSMHISRRNCNFFIWSIKLSFKLDLTLIKKYFGFQCKYFRKYYINQLPVQKNSLCFIGVKKYHIVQNIINNNHVFKQYKYHITNRIFRIWSTKLDKNDTDKRVSMYSVMRTVSVPILQLVGKK